MSPTVSQKLSVIPFGVDTDLFSDADNQSELPDKPIRLCYIKSHRPVYGPDILIKAFSSLAQSDIPLHLTMAGAGVMTGSLKKMAEDLGIKAKVEFTGQLTPPEVKTLIHQSHIVVMPSRQESFGVAALEASACACPVIASRIGGIPEVVKDGETGILVPPNDVDALAAAIRNLADDAELRRQLGKAGRDFVKKNYSWDRSLDMMCELYNRLIDGKTDSQTVRS